MSLGAGVFATGSASRPPTMVRAESPGRVARADTPPNFFRGFNKLKELRPLCRAAGLYPGLSTGHGGRQLEPQLYLKRAAPSPSPTWQISGRWLMEMPSIMLWRAQPMPWPAPGLMGPFDSPYKPPARAGAPGWIVNKPHTHTEVGLIFALYTCTMPSSHEQPTARGSQWVWISGCEASQSRSSVAEAFLQ